MQDEKEKKQSTGAWVKNSKNNKNFISFIINNITYNMFKNEFKTKPSQPDYIIYESSIYQIKTPNE